MPTISVQSQGRFPVSCDVDRVPYAGEIVELVDGTLVQVIGVTLTPYRRDLAAVIHAGVIEDPARINAEVARLEQTGVHRGV